ncbi:hypothetical protein DdX_14555 [Ditylenchus destructor]|uniref:Uncharacterized protein n=1 Tax=Ditylenchus destructor TaxID=166010 RepID=A0AAD4MRW1_9BILA|nr:hypothetical protein DdX_14555 [Ditylenchus destructor]
MQHSRSSSVCSNESAESNDSKASENAKPSVDEVQVGVVLATSDSLKSKFGKIIAEVNAAQKDLVESTCDLEKKFQNSEAEKQQLTDELHTLEAKNRETLERNRELEQELSNSQAKIRDLEAKFAQTDVSRMIAVLKENVEKLENGEISRLQNEVAKLSDENAIKKQEIRDLQMRYAESEKRIAGMKKEKDEMAEELDREHSLCRQLRVIADEHAEEIRKMKAESKDKQSLQLQSTPGLDPILPAWLSAWEPAALPYVPPHLREPAPRRYVPPHLRKPARNPFGPPAASEAAPIRYVPPSLRNKIEASKDPVWSQAVWGLRNNKVCL